MGREGNASELTAEEERGQSLGKGGRRREWTEPEGGRRGRGAGTEARLPRSCWTTARGQAAQSSVRAAHGEAQALKSSSGQSVETRVQGDGKEGAQSWPGRDKGGSDLVGTTRGDKHEGKSESCSEVSSSLQPHGL